MILLCPKIKDSEQLYLTVISSWVTLLGGLGGYSLLISYVSYKREKKKQNIQEEVNKKIAEKINSLQGNMEAQIKSRLEAAKKSAQDDINFFIRIAADDTLDEAARQKANDCLQQALKKYPFDIETIK